MVYVFGIYAFVNFAIFMVLTMGQDPKAVAEHIQLRGFSGHWMIFYAAALGILYSAVNMTDKEKKCSNGHAVSPFAKFCEQCGAPTV